MNKITFYLNIFSSIIFLIFTAIFTIFGVYCCFFFVNYSVQQIIILSFCFLFYFSVALIPGPLLIVLYFPFKKITICDDCIIFKILFRTQIIKYEEILSISKEKYLSFITRSKTYYDDCLYFNTAKFKKTKRMDLSIPISKVFCKSTKKMKERYNALMLIFNKSKCVDQNLKNELEEKYHSRTSS